MMDTSAHLAQLTARLHDSRLPCMTCLCFPQVVSEVMSRDLKMEVDDELLQAAKH